MGRGFGVKNKIYEKTICFLLLWLCLPDVTGSHRIRLHDTAANFLLLVQKINEMGKVCFYTLGPEFTRLLFSFIQEGRFKAVYNTLIDGGMPEDMIGDFFRLKYKFEGDSRDKEGLSIVPNEPEEDVNDFLFYGVMTCMRENFDEEEFYSNADKWNIYEAAEQSEDLKIIFQHISIEEFVKTNLPRIMRSCGYKVRESEHGEKFSDGVILQDGTVIQCGYQEHAELYPVLFRLGLANKSDWSTDTKCIHVTSGQVIGNVSHELQMTLYHDCRMLISDAQMETLFKYRNHISGQYGEDDSIVESIRRVHIKEAAAGGKYGNLDFLRKYYPHIKIPEISLENNFEGNISIRTSPELSLPGLLNSVFDIPACEAAGAIEKINSDWEKVKDVREGNSLHLFYQKNISGQNGVCHYIEERDFSYAVSEEQGKIVSGGSGRTILSNEEYTALRKIASELYHDLKAPVQLEFVVSNGTVYIVQLRILQNNVDNCVKYAIPGNAFVAGRSFSKGYAENIAVSDILIVKNEADSKMLLGKKALIVEDDVAFSHILALSKALRIPSMYGTGPVDLSKHSSVNFYSQITEGYITPVE